MSPNVHKENFQGLEQFKDETRNGSLWLLLRKHALQEVEKELFLDTGSL